ncbi:MAG: phenylalanine--tRNA ligase beta subunit-related protein, partial [Actinomycetota bacterium]|nr:phenylalanine--tRNA ligase beta subunit-related protein [Actinomycetota bacterium]
MTQDALEQFLAGAVVDDAVFALRPDYRALLLAVDGVVPGPSDDASEALLLAAETAADEAITDCPIEELPHVAAWRDAYRSFGVKPQRTRHSLEAMLRRVEEGLPRVNRLTDIYNSISVRHQIPIGGEDLQQYDGSPRLVRSAGNEPFDTVVGGMKMIEHPDNGEVIWRDDTGVTCRRWNWRQGRRTALSEDTTSALFILDILKPMSDEAAEAAADELLAELGPDVRSARR